MTCDLLYMFVIRVNEGMYADCMCLLVRFVYHVLAVSFASEYRDGDISCGRAYKIPRKLLKSYSFVHFAYPYVFVCHVCTVQSCFNQLECLVSLFVCLKKQCGGVNT